MPRATSEEALRRGLDGFHFFGYALGHHYIFGEHKPGRTNIWERFEQARAALPDDGRRTGGIGTPDQLRAHLRNFADAGVDQVIFIQQGGNNRHEHICESLELFASRRDAGVQGRARPRAQKQKQAELAPFIEAAHEAQAVHARRSRDDEIPTMVALGRQITEISQGVQQQGGGGGIGIPSEDPAARR